MIHYHGFPITPATVANYAVQAGHAFVSYAHPDQIGTAIQHRWLLLRECQIRGLL